MRLHLFESIIKAEERVKMKTDFFDQPKLLGFLQKKGYSITKATVLRYVQNGYAMQPQRRLTNELGTRIYYHLLTAIEIMTVALLFKGDFLEPNSKTRIARFTGEDVFLARLKFYAEPQFFKMIEECFSFQSFEFDTERYEFRDMQKSVEMNISDIEAYLAKYQEVFFQKFGDEAADWRFRETYLHFLKEIYRATYLHLFMQYKKDLLSLIPSDYAEEATKR